MKHTVRHLEGHDLLMVQVHTDGGDVLFEGFTDITSWGDDAIDEMAEYLSISDPARLVYHEATNKRFFNTVRLYH